MAQTVFGAVTFYTATTPATGVTGLTVAGMVDVYQIAKLTGASSQVVTDGLAIEIGQGMYGYAYGSADTSLYAYLAVFTTANTTVYLAQPCVWMSDLAEAAALAVAQADLDNPSQYKATGFAVAGDQMDLVNAPNGTAITAIQLGLATGANQTTILARLGAWTGTTVNTILGAFKALLSKTASAPSDIGGTFDPSTDSTEAIRDTAPLGTAMRGTDSAALAATALSNLTWTDAKAGYLTGPAALETTLTALKGVGWATETLKAIYDQVVLRLLTSAYTTPPAASAIADAICDEAISGHLTSGTVGAKINLLGGATSTVAAPTASSGAITLYKGDDYDADESRQITIADSGTWPSLSGATVKLIIDSILEAGVTGTASGSVPSQSVAFELTAAQVSAAGTYSYAVVATLATALRVVTLAVGTCTVKDRAPNA